MASKRKRYVPHRGPTSQDAQMYAEFMADLLDGTVKATQLVESRPGGHGQVQLDYDDPNG